VAAVPVQFQGQGQAQAVAVAQAAAAAAVGGGAAEGGEASAPSPPLVSKETEFGKSRCASAMPSATGGSGDGSQTVDEQAKSYIATRLTGADGADGSLCRHRLAGGIARMKKQEVRDDTKCDVASVQQQSL